MMNTERDRRFQNRAKLREKQREKPKANAPQTRKAGGDFKDKLQAYLALHAHALFSSLGRMLKTPFTSTMTIMVLAIAIALAGGFYLLLANVEQLTNSLEGSNQISLFLKQQVDDAEARKLADTIQQNPQVKSVKLLTKEDSLAEFKDFSGFGDAIKELDDNPLPTVIEVLPKNSLDSSEGLQQLVNQLKQLAQVDVAQLDMQWVRKLQSIVNLARSSMWLLSSMLSIAVLFVMGNTIRLELEGRREEVLISKLVGATHSFIQRPYLYTGFWFGFFAGTVAWIMVTTMMLILKQPIENLSMLYEKSYSVVFLSFFESIEMLFFSALLGVLGAWIVLHYQLRQMKLE
jgi:cell division transport system permease protein